MFLRPTWNNNLGSELGKNIPLFVECCVNIEYCKSITDLPKNPQSFNNDNK